jgi:hypothetical protein
VVRKGEVGKEDLFINTQLNVFAANVSVDDVVLVECLHIEQDIFDEGDLLVLVPLTLSWLSLLK